MSYTCTMSHNKLNETASMHTEFKYINPVTILAIVAYTYATT